MKNSNVLISAIVVLFLQFSLSTNAQDGELNISAGHVVQNESYSFIEGEIGLLNKPTSFYFQFGQGEVIHQTKEVYSFFADNERDNRVIAMGVRSFLGKNKKEYKGLNLDFHMGVIIDKNRVEESNSSKVITEKRTRLRSTIGVGYRLKRGRMFFDASALAGYVNIVTTNLNNSHDLGPFQFDPGINAKVGFSF